MPFDMVLDPWPLFIYSQSCRFLPSNTQNWKSCLCFTVGLASGHVVFTIASFLAMWRLHLESLPTMDVRASVAVFIGRATGGDVALY
jgi:hypothetical protein